MTVIMITNYESSLLWKVLHNFPYKSLCAATARFYRCNWC